MTKPPTTIESVCAVFVSRLSDDILIGIRFPWLWILKRLVDKHDSFIDNWLCVNCTEWYGFSGLHEYFVALGKLRIDGRDFDKSTNSYKVWCEVSFSSCDPNWDDVKFVVELELFARRRGLATLVSASDVKFSGSISYVRSDIWWRNKKRREWILIFAC